MDDRYSQCRKHFLLLNLVGSNIQQHFQPDFTPSKATPEAKEKFVKTIFGYVCALSSLTVTHVRFQLPILEKDS